MPRIKITINGEERTVSLKEARELLGELNDEIQDLGAQFNERKQKRDAGDESVELWPDDSRDRWDQVNQDFDALRAAIAEEERNAGVSERLSQLRNLTNPPTRNAPPNRVQTSTREIDVPATARAFAGTLRGFRGDHAERDAYASGQWVLGALFHRQESRQWCEDHGIETRAMSGNVNTAGGYLIPPEFSNTIIRLVEEYGIALAECQIVPMSGDSFSMPRRTGGVTLYAVNENDEVTASDASWDAIELNARKWAALVKYSSELSDDAVISIADFLAVEMAWATAKKMDESLLIGDGGSTYHGIKGIKNALAAGSEVTAATGNTAFSTLDLTDFEGMIGKLPSYAEANAKWVISKAGWGASMQRLANAAGGNTSREVEGGVRKEFLGYPVLFSPAMNATLTAQTSTEGLVFFGDYRQGAMIGMRRDIRLKVSGDRYLEYDQLGFLATVRFDINVHERGDASNAGSIIQLNTPGS